MKYQTRPQIVEAEQWRGSAANRAALVGRGVYESGGRWYVSVRGVSSKLLPGDWVTLKNGDATGHYSPQQFATLFEPVP